MWRSLKSAKYLLQSYTHTHTQLQRATVRACVNYSLGDHGLHEDENEDEERGDGGGEDAPHGQVLVLTHRVDEPAALGGVRWLQTVGHVELLRVRLLDQDVDRHHHRNGDWHAEVTQCASRLRRDNTTHFVC